MLKRFNDLPIFDPARWPAREAIARTLGCFAVLIFLARRITLLPAFPGRFGDVRWTWITDLGPWVKAWDVDRYYGPLGYSGAEVRAIWTMRLVTWCLESGILLAYIAAWLTRDRAKSVAKGFMETVFPLMLGALPFLIVMTEYAFPKWMPPSSRAHLPLYCAISALVIIGAAINLAGLVALRRSFTIMSEARTLIRGGMFRYVRHPLYAGQFVLYFAYTLLHFHVSTFALYVTFVAAQVVRAGIEERKLAGVFPEYDEYRRSTGMFFPRVRKERA